MQLVYLNPRPDKREASLYYQFPNYDPHRTISENRWSTMYHLVQKFTLWWKYNKIASNKSSGRLLDIGGGKGEFAVFMAEKGWDVVLQDSISGIEGKTISQNIEFVKDLNLLNDDKKFDVITLWHSLEHIHNISELYSLALA